MSLIIQIRFVHTSFISEKFELKSVVRSTPNNNKKSKYLPNNYFASTEMFASCLKENQN